MYDIENLFGCMNLASSSQESERWQGRNETRSEIWHSGVRQNVFPWFIYMTSFIEFPDFSSCASSLHTLIIRFENDRPPFQSYAVYAYLISVRNGISQQKNFALGIILIEREFGFSEPSSFTDIIINLVPS